MIDLGTIAGLHEHEHQLAAYCPTCGRWRVLPLAHLVANGKGSLRLLVKVRYVKCGGPGRLQVRPPVPRPDLSLPPGLGSVLSNPSETTYTPSTRNKCNFRMAAKNRVTQ